MFVLFSFAEGVNKFVQSTVWNQKMQKALL